MVSARPRARFGIWAKTAEQIESCIKLYDTALQVGVQEISDQICCHV